MNEVMKRLLTVLVALAPATAHADKTSKAIAVSGNGNSIDVTSVDKLATSGNNNTARWTKGVTGGKPRVSNTGTNNTVLQTK